jgi:hypothetical protein
MVNKLHMANNLRMVSNRAKDNTLLLPTIHNNRVAIKINTLLSQTTEAPLRHTPQPLINNLHIHSKALPTLSRAKRLTNLRTGPRKHIQTSLRTARIGTATNKKAYPVLMERRVSAQHL